MNKINLCEYISKLETAFYNPFTQEDFLVLACESYTKGVDFYYVDNVLLTFKNNSCIITFDYKDTLLAFYIYAFTSSHSFDYDPHSLDYLNEHLLNQKSLDSIKTFTTIFETAKNFNIYTENNIIKILYSNSEDGKDSFEYHKSLIIWTTDKFSLDDAKYNKEIKRREFLKIKK